MSKHSVSANMTHGHNGFMVDIELEGREPAHEQLDGGDAAVARGAVDHDRASHALKNVGQLKWLARCRGLLCSLKVKCSFGGCLSMGQFFALNILKFDGAFRASIDRFSKCSCIL